MSDFSVRPNLAGAVDLSSLRNKAQSASATDTSGPAAQQDAPPMPAQSPTDAIKVPDLVALADANNLKTFVEISGTVPVVIDFFADWSDQSKALSATLEHVVRSLHGRILLVKIDTQASPEVVQAFAIKAVPAVVALVKGQPVPLFEGNQTQDAISQLMNRLLEMANQNGMVGQVVVSDEFSQPTEPALPPLHQKALEAIDSADYLAAIGFYKDALRESPADAMAIAGLAQAELLDRTKAMQLEQVLNSAPATTDETLAKADACVAVGQFGLGFQTILTRFASADNAEREVLRKHLLELFKVCDPAAPELAQARKALAALLY